MTVALTLVVLAGIIAVNVFLWKSGFLFDAERPKPVIDVPVKDPKMRQAAMLRISRWRAQGRITREEAEHWQMLCEQHWDRED